MFNLPWYAWLNLLGLPVLWLMMYVDQALLEKPQWLKLGTSLMIAASAIAVVLFWNPTVNALFYPLQYCLIALILPMSVLHMGVAITGVMSAAYAFCMAFSRQGVEQTCRSESAPGFNIEDDEIDLDGGEQFAGRQDEKLGEAISSLFSKDASLKTNIKSIVTLTGAEPQNLEADDDLLAQAVHAAVVVVFLLPPMLWSLQLI
ncbi:MAG: hypothetical protein AB8B79_14240 [Granulosicoccus sp.]